MNPLISIIVPIYNAEKYLKVCIDSIISQTYKNIEIILINDGSTDNSSLIINEYKKKDKRIIVKNNRNIGVSETRNLGVKISNGEFVVFIDSDDWIDKNMIQEMYKSLKKNNVDVVRCSCFKMRKDGSFEKENMLSLSNVKLTENEIKNNINMFTTKNKISDFSVLLLIKKKKYVNFSPNLSFVEDMAFYVELLLNIKSIYFLDKPLYYYRYNMTSVTKSSNNSFKNCYSAIRSCNYIINFLKSENVLNNFLFKKIYSNFINMIFLKMRINYPIKYNIIKDKEHELFFNKDFIYIFKNCNIKELSNANKITYILLLFKLFYLNNIYWNILSIKK